ncbi:hypothetical protein ABW17_02245 [Mycobacterium nebraskense]|uniref:Zn-ribbon domain-containing OB-fold protein n=1 Tax=Mycobacterium nebraskense TaxID=244292 RepID=UPI0006423BE2|nr:OB-fold domain-containing protein [Mycobacterium nebraskense]KLO46678.1 hypothetical protein ABW17_02245 [Mycobacterium nebraskense]
MSSDEKFLPEDVPEWQQPFWDSLRDRDIRIQRCTSCGAFRHVPKEICAKCHSLSFSWAPISGRGVVYTYTIVHRAPTPAYQAAAPYAIVYAAMDEGFRMIGTMAGGDPAAVEIGAPVRIVYTDLDPAWTIVEFETVIDTNELVDNAADN